MTTPSHTDLAAQAKSCGATVYTHRTSPHEPAIAFSPAAWEKFAAALESPTPPERVQADAPMSYAELEDMNAQLREQNTSLDTECARLENEVSVLTGMLHQEVCSPTAPAQAPQAATAGARWDNNTEALRQYGEGDEDTGDAEAHTMLKSAPERIWLNVDDYPNEHTTFPDDHEGITWCTDEIGFKDVPYIRADLAALRASTPAERVPGDEALMRQALEALVNSWRELPVVEKASAITALRARLETSNAS